MPVKVWDATWALLVEIDLQEVISDSMAAKHLLRKIWWIGIASGAAIFLVILFNIFRYQETGQDLEEKQ